MLASYISAIVFDRPDVPEWLETAFVMVDYKYLFWFGLVICAPVLEEVLFRGYILRAWLESKLHPSTAILLVSVLWALTHFQYDFYDMFWVFILGVLLAYSRVRSGSLYPAISIHCAWNFVAYIGLEYHLG
jgi:membrane protease YdiL (CAAX protease family)